MTDAMSPQALMQFCRKDCAIVPYRTRNDGASRCRNGGKFRYLEEFLVGPWKWTEV